MKISKKAEYALRAMVAIARRSSAKPVSIQELASEGAIPLKFLEQILLNLKNGGLLVSKRGVGGGYRLAKPAAQVTIGEVLTLVDGAFSPLPEVSPNSGLARCFSELEGLVNGFLSDHSIQDVIALERDEDAMAFEI